MSEEATAVEASVGSNEEVTPVSAVPDVEKGSFLETLPEEYRQEPSLQKYKTQQDLLDNYLSLERYRGKSIAVPGEDATEDQRTEYLEKLRKFAPELQYVDDTSGRPEAPDQYEELEGLTDNSKAFDPLLYEAGLTNKQRNALQQKITEADKFASTQATEAHNADIKSIKDEWGMAYDERYQVAYAAARTMAEVNGDHEAFASGNVSSATIRTYYEFGKRLGSEGVNMTEKEVISTKLTPLEIQTRIDEILVKMKEIAPSDPVYKEMLAEKRKLYQMRTAGKKVDKGYEGAGIGGVEFV